MAKKRGKSARSTSALDALLRKTGQSTHATISLSGQYDSVLSVARSDLTGLMNNNPGLHISEARELLQRARAHAVVTARQFREQRLTASVKQANRPPTGLKGLVDGPTYTDMFNPDWANHCPPDAIEATTSPVAYLADLYRYAKELEATGDAQRVIGIDDRRPDLKDLVLDHTTLNQVVPTITLVNEILEKSIRAHLDSISLEDKGVDDALLEARYPNELPFERYTSQINHVLGSKGYSLGDVIRLTDPAYPYFKEPGVHSTLSDIALIQDTGFGPIQQGLLLEAPYFPESSEEGERPAMLIANEWRVDRRTGLLVDAAEDDGGARFFKDNFGVDGFIELQDTQAFCLRTGLSTAELDALLSVGPYAPVPSANVLANPEGEARGTKTRKTKKAKAEEALVDGRLFGSVYINAGMAPGMAIETLPASYAEVDGETVMVEGPRHLITHASEDRFDRMNRMIRLARWLEMPFDQVDQIVVASMRAEKDNASYTLTSDTLRALGLFQTLRRKYKVTAEDFAALIQGMGTFARGKTPSHFDRVFNGKALFPQPLRLDGTPLIVNPTEEADRQRVEQLCAALSMPYETFRYVAKVIEQSYGGEPLVWSLSVVSSFYRIVRLPRYLGLLPGEAIALIELLNQSSNQLLLKLVGETRVATYSGSNNADVISAIAALVECAEWCSARRWGIAQLCSLTATAFTQPLQTEAQRGVLENIYNRLQSALVTENSFIVAGAPMTREGAPQPFQFEEVLETFDWFTTLNIFLEGDLSGAKGVVRMLSNNDDVMFEQQLQTAVNEAFADWPGEWEETSIKITNMIMRARAAQASLVLEGLASYLGISADVANELLTWCGGNCHQLLLEVCRVFSSGIKDVAIGDEVLLLLSSLERASVLVNALELSALGIQTIIARHPWFIIEPVAELTLRDIYFLTQYAYGSQKVESSEASLLGYFLLINTYWQEGASDVDKLLIRDGAADRLATLLSWNIREVLTSAYHFNPDSGVIFTFSEFDSLVRFVDFSQLTNLSAESIIALGRLDAAGSAEVYRRAAELALSSLGRSEAVSPPIEVGQSNESFIVVIPNQLIAGNEGEQALVTVTLRDFMGKHLENVTIRWSTSAGSLAEDESRTDEHGEASTYFHPGDEKTVAVVEAQYGLGVTLKSPGISIGSDEATLAFTNAEQSTGQALANGTDPVEFSAVLVDRYGNTGTDQPVRWLASLGRFNPPVSYADAEGLVRSRLFSQQIGEASAVVEYHNGSSHSFSVVKFESIPYIQYIKFTGSLVEGIEVEVRCRFVEINGDPKANVEVKWESTMGELASTASKTDADGVAVMIFTPEKEGDVEVTAKVGNFQKSTGVHWVSPTVRVADQGASDTYYVVGSATLVEFFVRIEVSQQPASLPVSWSIDSGTPLIVRSDAQGISRFKSAFTAGKHRVIATVSGVEVAFEVEGVRPGRFRVTYEGVGDNYGSYVGAEPFCLPRDPLALIVSVVAEDGAVQLNRPVSIKVDRPRQFAGNGGDAEKNTGSSGTFDHRISINTPVISANKEFRVVVSLTGAGVEPMDISIPLYGFVYINSVRAGETTPGFGFRYQVPGDTAYIVGQFAPLQLSFTGRRAGVTYDGTLCIHQLNANQQRYWVEPDDVHSLPGDTVSATGKRFDHDHMIVHGFELVARS